MPSVSEQDLCAAPCLVDGPISEQAKSAVLAVRQLGDSRFNDVIRVWAVAFLFDEMDRVFAADKDPVAEINISLERLRDYTSELVRSGFAVGSQGLTDGDETDTGVAETTGQHYSQLFDTFTPETFWNDSVKLLLQRFERNNIDVTQFKGKSLLDAGCGSGRFTVAWKQLGVDEALGVDISTSNVNTATQRVAEADFEGAKFQQADVLDLPFADDSFDIVYSNGVLHHTVDCQAGVHELMRVMKPGGFGWLYLIENPGGLYWDIVELSRLMMSGVSTDLAVQALQLLGIQPYRICHILDHITVPINLRSTVDEVVGFLTQAGASQIKRLERGSDFDRVERIHRQHPWSKEKYGIGENRFIFSKS